VLLIKNSDSDHDESEQAMLIRTARALLESAQKVLEDSLEEAMKLELAGV